MKNFFFLSQKDEIYKFYLTEFILIICFYTKMMTDPEIMTKTTNVTNYGI